MAERKQKSHAVGAPGKSARAPRPKIIGEQGSLRNEPAEMASGSARRKRIAGIAAAAGTIAAGAILGAVVGRRARGIDAPAQTTPAAFKSAAASPASFDHTRDAGAENIRDHKRERGWDKVDQSGDESFPASDPPATY